MPDKEYKSRIERLKRRLYSKNKPVGNILSNTFSFKKKRFDIKPDWERQNGDKAEKSKILPFGEDLGGVSNNESITKKKKMSTINKVLMGAFLFLIIAIGFAYFSIIGNKNRISSDNIDITLSGPILVNAGEVLSFEIDVTNKNNVDLEAADLLIEYPDGARDPENVKNTIKRSRKSLGAIKAGEQKQEVVEAILFGEEGSTKEIKVGVEYRVSDSNAIFFTERKYEVKINTSPISVDVSSRKEVGSGQDVEFAIEIRSNSEKDLENIIVEAKYPFGFTVTESKPKAINGDRTWRIDKLKSGEKRSIVVNGKIEAQDGETRVFRFNAGLEDEKIDDKIGVIFVSNSKSVVIKRPSVSLDVVVNNSSKTEQVIKGDKKIRVDISWKNNLPIKIQNGIIKVKLDGEVIDKSSVVSSNGFYKSSDNTILWDKRSNNELGIIDGGESGTISFSFLTKQPSSIVEEDIENAGVEINTSFSGDRTDESTKNILSNTKNNLKISSYTSLASKAVYFEGDFINTGPLPPTVNSETTYTIVLSVSNLINDISGAVVTATLPPYVRWMNVYSSTNEDVSYNPVGGEVRWKVGDVYSGTGYKTPAKELQFQVALIPSISLVGETPDLVENIEFSGLDVFTDTSVKIQGENIDTRLKFDAKFKKEMSDVIQ